MRQNRPETEGEVRGNQAGGGRSLPALVLGQLVHLAVHGQAQELLPRGPHLLPAGLRGSIKVTSNCIQLLKDSGGPALLTNNAKARK